MSLCAVERGVVAVVLGGTAGSGSTSVVGAVVVAAVVC